MKKTVTTRYDVAEHLRTPEEMAAYLEACMEEADGDAAFVARENIITPISTPTPSVINLPFVVSCCVVVFVTSLILINHF